MKKLSQQQKVQEKLYDFPYHYSVKFKDYFSMFYLFDWGLNYASAIEFLLKKITLNPIKNTIIDIGCGEGRLTRELHLKFKNSVVHGVDYSIKSINMAKALNSDMNIDFFAKNIIEDSLKRTYDVATLMEVYEHIPPEISNDFLSGIHKLLNNEGILHLTVPHKNVPVSAHHFRHFSVKSLVTELEPYFDIIEVMPFEKISIKRKWLMKLFINKFFILNHKTLTTKLYNYYKSSLFFVQKEDQCQRIYIQCKKK